MPEKPPSTPPPSEPEIIFVSPEDEDSEWSPELLGRVLELRIKLMGLLPPRGDTSGNVPIFHAPAFFKRLNLASGDDEASLMTGRLVEAERDLAKGKAPAALSPSQMIKIYTEMITSSEKYRKK